jgi:hypothetical protein
MGTGLCLGLIGLVLSGGYIIALSPAAACWSFEVAIFYEFKHLIVFIGNLSINLL